MADVINQLDQIERKIMSGLKDFQQATVNRVDQLYRQGQMRILISDEVGLGKTLIARGTVAKVAQIQKEAKDKLVKVVYICSNVAIAEQNLNKLRISNDLRVESAGSSRLSMQHLNIFWQENDPELLSRYIQLIPLTPETSFRPTSGQGTVSERALMFAILKRIDLLKNHLRELEALMQYDAYSAWPNWCRDLYEDQVKKCNDYSHGEYLKYMTEMVRSGLLQKGSDGTALIERLLDVLQRIKSNSFKYVSAGAEIGSLRMLFAQISIDKLEPDLVIMDEFQRFKYLISSDDQSETGLLRQKFFNSETVRMLLLSATPYKMYSTLDEIDEAQVDEHYSEFLNVMDFLNINQEDKQHFKEVWSDYSVQLKELTKGQTTIIQAKCAAEETMYEHICRTERISAPESADIIDDSDVRHPLCVTEQDIKSYVQAQKLIEDIGAPFNVPIDYIKSTPYILSFMRDYQFKRHIEKHFASHTDEIGKANRDLLWVKRSEFDRYGKIPNANSRLDRVMNYAFQSNAELLLWVPPCKPYYEFEGVYKNTGNFSKTLVFSSWEMVPRMLAGLMSYEAERRTTGKLAKQEPDKDAHYFFSGEKRYPLARLNFSVSNGTPNAMTLFCLLYPSECLSRCYNPVDCMNRQLHLNEIEKEVKLKIKMQLDRYPSVKSGAQDLRWYYLAPLLLDDSAYALAWLNSDDSLAAYDDDEVSERRQKGFLTHLHTLQALYKETASCDMSNLGKRPDDLLDVLTDMAIASPAICIYRTYCDYFTSTTEYSESFPSQVAKVFLNRMNSPESTAVIKLSAGKKNDEAHWQNLLTYCKYGNMQAMFDEYAHVIANGFDKDAQLVKRMHSLIINSMNVRTTSYNIDTFTAFRARANGKKEKTSSIRTHFAVAFTKGDGKEKDADRKKSVRNAFNSPFRPFVLASTSIGQEGLDFHNYCRRIVHWNLPSNPIDLEQREGRINRFECLAIRQNIAHRYGNGPFSKMVWAEMFDTARLIEKTGDCSDLIPYWGLRATDDMVKIERIVPMYPYSRDEIAYERLIKILSLYRLTLGQARQEELLEYIFQNHTETEEMHKLFINLSPYYRKTQQQ